MFVVYPTNVDYLIEPVRLRIGDYEATLFSDAIVRSALLSAVTQLQRRWNNRYLVYRDTMLVSPQPDEVPSGYLYAALPDGYGYIVTGLSENDVFRNPYHSFEDPSSAVISQEDEDIIVVTAAIILMRARLGSSASSFISWSDGEYSYTNSFGSKVMSDMLKDLTEEFNVILKRRLASSVRDAFPIITI